MSIQQSIQPQVIDIRSSNTKVHINGYECVILTKENTIGSVQHNSTYCKSITIGFNTLNVGDVIIGQDINAKIVLPFKINRIQQYDMSKDLKKITLHSFTENPTKLFLAPTVGSIAFKIMKSPLFIGVFAYYLGVETKKFRHSVHFLLHYNPQIRNDEKFKLLRDMVENQSLEEEHLFNSPFDNDNYIVVTIASKDYWVEDYNKIMRSQYSLLSPNYLNFLKTHLSNEDYLFLVSIVNKSDILKQAWEQKLDMPLPNNVELYQAMDIEGIDGLYESQLISKQEYERVKNLAGYMV